MPIGSLTEQQLGDMGAPLFAPIRSGVEDLGFVCVLESESSDYLNTKAVQDAIHTSVANVSTWGPCGNSDKSGRHAHAAHRRAMEKAGLMGPSDTLGDLYKKLIPEIPILSQSDTRWEMGARQWAGLGWAEADVLCAVLCLCAVYSGDVDMCVPYFYSDNWLRRLGYAVTTEWVPWMYLNGPENQQLGGYVTHFNTKNLTFLTVKDSGHMVTSALNRCLLSRHSPAFSIFFLTSLVLFFLA